VLGVSARCFLRSAPQALPSADAAGGGAWGADLHRVAHINARSAQWEVLLDGRSHGEFPSELDPSRAHLPRSAPRLTEGSVCRRHPQEVFSPILRTMRRSDTTREPLWRPRSARDADGMGARWRLEALTKGASVPLMHTLAARRELVLADGHTTASTTRGTVMVACCSPSRSRRRRPRPLRPSAARTAGFRRPSLASYAAGSRGCSRPTAALDVALRRGHTLLGSSGVPAPRSSAATAAQGCSRRMLLLRLASCAAGTWT